MIFVDSNIPMYLIGQQHQNKETVRAILERLASQNKRLVTSAEVFQEIIHRYSSINKKEAISVAFEALNSICDEVFPIFYEDVMEAKNFLMSHKKISSRDCIHLAVMKRKNIKVIFTFDSDFDSIESVHRLYH